MSRHRKRKRSVAELHHYRLHDEDRPFGNYAIIETFPTMKSLAYHYEFVMKNGEVNGLFIIEEQDNDKKNPGRIIRLFCLARK